MTEHLAEHRGEWRGTNAFRLTPDDAPHEAGATVSVSTAVRGLVTEVAYTWSHPEDGEQEGLLVVSAADEPRGLTAMWCDTFHQSPFATSLTGTAEGAILIVGYSYAGDWEWRIVIDASDTGRLAIRMDNVVPESGADEGLQPGVSWAMNAELVRAGDLPAH